MVQKISHGGEIVTNKKVLVTGAGGFVGAHAATEFLRDGYIVHAVSRSSVYPRRLAQLCDGVGECALEQCDLSVAHEVEKLIERVRPHIIIHCATYGGYPQEKDADNAVMTNVVGSLNLFRAALSIKGVERIVNMGSSSEYGEQDHSMREDDIPKPIGPYAVTKLTQTHLATAFAHHAQLPIVTLRPFSVFGVLEEPGRLFADVVRAHIKGETLRLGDPRAERDFVYITDVIEAMRKICGTPGIDGEVFNIGTGRATTIQDVVDTVSLVTGKTIPLVWGNINNQREHTSTTWLADNTKAREKLAWKPSHTVDEGVRDMLAWYEKHPSVL